MPKNSADAIGDAFEQEAPKPQVVQKMVQKAAKKVREPAPAPAPVPAKQNDQSV